MRIAEVAARSGLSIDTIRYYERTGMLPRVPRGTDGQRRFSMKMVEWLTTLYWLRETGMPMKVMHHYAELVFQGSQTAPDRRAILEQHAGVLTQRRQLLDRCEALVHQKIAFYSDMESQAPKRRKEEHD